MQDVFNAQIYNERNDHIKEILSDHESRLNDNEKRIVSQEKEGTEFRVNINILLKKMDSFINTLKWSMGIFVTISLFVIGLILV